ncbi:MAG TPA: putative Ig domain-containing protein [Verrucomicrobiae bacterium]|nr:putative Ig domain-containing protein [Verrucomicrobiae bacterium]
MKFLSILAPPPRRWRAVRNIWFLVVLLSPLPVASLTHAQTNGGFSGFNQPFDPTSSNIVYTTTNYSGFFPAGDPIGLGTRDGSALTVFAWTGQLLYTGAATNLTLPVGHYFVQAGNDRNEFAVLPADWPTLTNLGDSGEYGPFPPAQALESFLKLGWIRGGIDWNTVQAGGSNSWDWSFTDQIINLHHGLRKLVIQLQGAPNWIQDPTTGAWKVSRAQWLQAYTRFVQAIAQRYTNSIDVMEVWNEPYDTDVLPTTNLTDTTTLYVQMLAVARAAFPSSVKLSGPTVQSSLLVNYAQSVAAAGGAQYIDYDSFHDYETRNGAPDIEQTNNSLWLTIPARVQENSAVFQKQLMVDEIGLYGQSALGPGLNPVVIPGDVLNSGINWFTGMTYAVKYAVMYSAGNAIQMPQTFLEGASTGEGSPGTSGTAASLAAANLEINGFDLGGRGPHPKTSAFLVSQYWLAGSTLAGWRSPGQQIFLYAWQRPDNTSIVFAWTIDGQTASLSTNSALTATDIYGTTIQPTTLNNMPILFHSNSPDAVGLLNSVLAALPNVNLPPILNPVDNQSVLVNQPLQFAVSATDPNNNPLNYSASPLPSGASLDPTNGTFSWTPSSSQGGLYQITFVATDSAGLSVSNTTLISVLASETDGLIDWWKFDQTSGTIATDSAGTASGTLSNFAFTATSGWTTGIIGGALAFDGVDDFVHLDSSQLNLTNNFSVSAWLRPHDAINGACSYLSVRSRYASSGFNFEINKTGLQLTGQTTAGWQIIGFYGGQFHNDTWYHVVVVYDKSTIKVYINGVAITADFGADPNLGGDFIMDPTASSKIGAENANSDLGYVFNGLIDDLRIYNRTLIPAEIQALYQEGDQPPVLAPISAQTVGAGQLLEFPLSASDPDSATLTYSAGPLPSGASFDSVNGIFSWIPTLSQTGAYSVTFSVTDGLLTNSQTASITVTGDVSQVVDQPPALTPISDQTVAAGQPLAFTLSATDPDSTNLTFFAAPLPAGATVSASTGAFSWTPTLSQTGAYAVTFSVTDGLLTNSQTASITVTGSVNQVTDQPPVLAPVAAQSVVAGQVLSFTLSASDPDSSTLTYSANALPDGASLDPTTGAFTWTPSNTQTGVFSVTFTVSDGLLTSSQAATITVFLNTVPITVQVNPSDGGTVSGGGIYTVGSQAQIAATPNPGWVFTGWDDGNTQNPRTVTVREGGASFTANLGQQSTSNSVQITSGPSVTNAVLEVGGLAVVVADETNVLSVTATDSTTSTLFYTWTFGDGEIGDRSASSTAAHVYTNCGPFVAGVTVDDGINSTNANLTIAVACMLNISKLQVTANFAKTNADACTVKGTFDLPSDYSFTGKVVTVNIGGAQVSFTLDAKGRGRTGSSVFNKPAYNSKTGLWAFNATLRAGTWQPFWSAYGLVDANVLKPGNAVSLPVILVIDNEAFMQIPNLLYTSKAGKSGTAK